MMPTQKEIPPTRSWLAGILGGAFFALVPMLGAAPPAQAMKCNVLPVEQFEEIGDEWTHIVELIGRRSRNSAGPPAMAIAIFGHKVTDLMGAAGSLTSCAMHTPLGTVDQMHDALQRLVRAAHTCNPGPPGRDEECRLLANVEVESSVEQLSDAEAEFSLWLAVPDTTEFATVVVFSVRGITDDSP